MSFVGRCIPKVRNTNFFKLQHSLSSNPSLNSKSNVPDSILFQKRNLSAPSHKTQTSPIFIQNETHSQIFSSLTSSSFNSRRFSSTSKHGAVISAFELYSIGIGPSSSHTVGPMRAARKFTQLLEEKGLLNQVTRVKSDLFGSLAATGEGHGTTKAIIMGLEGQSPEGVDPDIINPRVATIRTTNELNLGGKKIIKFQSEDLLLHKKIFLPYHPNGLEFTAYGPNNEVLFTEKFYSIGGGFIIDHSSTQMKTSEPITEEKTPPLIFSSSKDLLRLCKIYGMSIRDVMYENEKTWRSDGEIRSGLLNIWSTMNNCIRKGLNTPGILPGGLNVRRRAPNLYEKLKARPMTAHPNDWVTAWAIAVNEENASGSRVVTAPTNGASGIIPAVLKYYTRFVDNASEDGIITFLLTASAIGMLFKHGASISAAEVGCQGEVGVACSMAAAALTATQGGTPEQIETAAEIGMEHHLGLTCDPINGLVQIPCIERNVMGSINAIAASRLALLEDGKHIVSLDSVIKTMANTGREMHSKFKETSEGGLAVHAALPEC